MKNILLLFLIPLLNINAAFTQKIDFYGNLEKIEKIYISIEERRFNEKEPVIRLSFRTYNGYPNTGFRIQTSTKIVLDTLIIELKKVYQQPGANGKAVSTALGTQVIPKNIKYVKFEKEGVKDVYSIVLQDHVAKIRTVKTTFSSLRDSSAVRRVKHTICLNGDSLLVSKFLSTLPNNINLIPYSYPKNALLPPYYRSGIIYQYERKKHFKMLLDFVKENSTNYSKNSLSINIVFWNGNDRSYHFKAN